MTLPLTPIALYGRIRALAAWNLLVSSGMPLPVTVGLALLGAATSVQFASLLGTALGQAQMGGIDDFAGVLGALLSVFQLVFAFVVVGSISIRMFDPRKAAELDAFAALPLRRVDRFLVQISDVAAVPMGILLVTIVPAFAMGAVRGGMKPLPGVLFVVLASMVCMQPVPALIAAYAFVLRFTPPALLRNRGLLFAAFSAAVLPLVPVLSSIMTAWHDHLPPSPWLPAGWATLAIRAAEKGNFGETVLPAAAVVLSTLLLSLAAYVAFDRVLLERYDEILARLSVFAPPDADSVRGRARRNAEGSSRAAVPSGLKSLRAALSRKETLALARDPALQLTMAALGASSLTFALFAGKELAMLATCATAFLAVYMAACLGLASFSSEGRGLPVLAPLPLSALEVLRAKLMVNTAMLVLAGLAGGAAIGLAFAGAFNAVLLVPLFAWAGAITAAPLGGLVTAMGALFPRRLLRTGRREISAMAMSFFTALALLFYASVVTAFAAPLELGLSFAWMPVVVIAAWSFVAAALVAAAAKAVRRGRSEG